MALSNEMHRLTQGFLSAHGDRVAAVAASADHTAQELSGFQAARESMSAEQRQRLAQGADRLHDHVTKTLDSLETAHQEMAAEQRQRLAQGADRLRDHVTKTLDSLETAHQEMAARQRRRLAEDRTRLASEVSRRRGGVQADQGEAHRIWGSFATEMQERTGKTSGAPSPKASVAKAAQGLTVVARTPAAVAKAPGSPAKAARKPKARQKKSGKF